MRVGVITPVPIEAIRTLTRPARLAANRRDCVDQRDHRIHFGNVGGGVNCEDTFLDYTQVKAIYATEYPG